MDVYLVSDAMDLTGPVYGYFMRIGDTEDEISLYKQLGNKSTSQKIIDGQDDQVDVGLVELNIKVTKNHEDEWELLVDRGLSQNFVSEGIVTDGELFFSRFFRIYCNYTSTRSDKFFFDELSITGDSYSDLATPKVDSLIVMSDSSLQLFFNEKMLASSISNVDNYFVNNGIGNPVQIEFYQDSSAILYFKEKINDAVENQISIHGAEDLFRNSVNNLVMYFSYFRPYIIGFGDILISEIMADPSPKIDLPEYEYPEIHNPHPELFHLDLAKLIIVDDTTYIPDITIEPLEYIVLCQHAAVEYFENFGRTIKITNWPSLNNRGEYIILLNNNEKIVYAVNYLGSWYKSMDKDNGGYSLEMVDSDFPCKGSANWIASNDPSGGTPG